MGVDVSIIITAYNVEHYISRAIRSALAQEGVTAEIILVDDCSTDRTWDIVSAIQDPRLKTIQLPENSGPSVARNTAIAHATGTWIAVLDGDDGLEPGRLARCLKRARAMNADIVVDNLTIMRESDGKTFPMFPPSGFSQLKTLSLARCIEGNRSFFKGYTLGYLKPVFSADFLKKHNLSYDPDIRIGEDYFFLAGALASGAVCAVEHSAGYLYTVRAGSISHRLAPEDLTRISMCDQKFLALHTLDPAAMKAQRRREFSTKEAYAYTRLIAALKQKDIWNTFEAVALCPSAVRYLWAPVWVRLRRLAWR
jgi:succinoglycan biosynthesis protein ExoO